MCNAVSGDSIDGISRKIYLFNYESLCMIFNDIKCALFLVVTRERDSANSCLP